MKNKLFLSAVALGAVFMTSCEKESLIEQSDVPQEIKNYVTTHFPQNNILQTLKDNDGLNLTYDLLLDSSISLEFNRAKEIISIDGNSKLPDSVIPAKIREYVNTNFPAYFITDWEKESRKVQQIELSNGLDLEFDNDGKYLRIDN